MLLRALSLQAEGYEPRPREPRCPSTGKKPREGRRGRDAVGVVSDVGGLVTRLWWGNCKICASTISSNIRFGRSKALKQVIRDHSASPHLSIHHSINDENNNSKHSPWAAGALERGTHGREGATHTPLIGTTILPSPPLTLSTPTSSAVPLEAEDLQYEEPFSCVCTASCQYQSVT